MKYAYIFTTITTTILTLLDFLQTKLFSSFIHLRYWAVTYPHYIHSRNSTSIWMLISFVWIMSIVVSLAPLLGWKDENWSENVKDGKCMVSVVTQLFQTSSQCQCHHITQVYSMKCPCIMRMVFFKCRILPYLPHPHFKR